MSNLTEQLNALRLKDENIMKQVRGVRAAIQPQIDVLIAKHELFRETAEGLIVDLIESQGIEALYNIDSAREIYTEAWNRGTGSGKISGALRELFKSFSYLDSDRHCVNREDNNQAVSNLRVLIPTVYNLTALEGASKAAERILEVQMEIMKDSENKPSIDVYYEPGNLTGRITSDDGIYLEIENYNFDEPFENLFEAVKAAVKSISEMSEYDG